MRSARTFALVLFVATFAFNEWAFRFIFLLEPIDSFLRLMTLVLDGFALVAVIALGWKNVSLTERLKHLELRFPRTVAMYIGLFIALCCVMGLEFSFRYYFKHHYKAPYREATYWEPCATIPDSTLGTALIKDSVFSHAYIVNDSLIYKQYYKTDEFGRRITPEVWRDSSRSEFIMTTGCSFVFGYGLDENQTLAYYLDSLSGLKTYNYGISGHGTQQTLALLQSRNLKEEMTGTNGVLIHLFIDHHMVRLIGSRRLIKLWATHFPYYQLEDGKPVRHGSFWTGRHLLTRFYRAISQSAILDLFDIDFPLRIRDDDFELFGAVLQESESEFLKQYPNGRFLVVIGPGSKYADRATNALRNDNVPFLDLSNFLDPEEKRYQIHWTEAHPNGNYYREVADTICQFLNLQPTNGQPH